MVFHFVDRLNPVRYRLKSLSVSQIKTKNDTICLSIKLVSNVSELLLPRCVPNLDLDSLIVLLIVVLSLDEIDSDSLQVIGNELALVLPPQQTSLANFGIAKYN